MQYALIAVWLACGWLAAGYLKYPEERRNGWMILLGALSLMIVGADWCLNRHGHNASS